MCSQDFGKPELGTGRGSSLHQPLLFNEISAAFFSSIAPLLLSPNSAGGTCTDVEERGFGLEVQYPTPQLTPPLCMSEISAAFLRLITQLTFPHIAGKAAARRVGICAQSHSVNIRDEAHQPNHSVRTAQGYLTLQYLRVCVCVCTCVWCWCVVHRCVSEAKKRLMPADDACAQLCTQDFWPVLGKQFSG